MKKLSVWAVLLVAAATAAILAIPRVPASAPAATPVAAPASGDAKESLVLTVLHVNDVHGQTEPHLDHGKSIGGYSRLSTLVAAARASHDANLVLLLHAGDEFSKADPLTRRTLGAANVQIWNYLRFDAWTPGNGDYYDGTGNLRKRIAEANFPTLTANVTVKDDGNCLAQPYVIKQVGPVKVALFGLCTVYKDQQAGGGLVQADPVETASKLVPQLRKQADVVIALTHIGYTEDVKLAQAVAGIDLIVGGHSHTVLDNGQSVAGPGDKQVLIVQTGWQLEFMGCVELGLKSAGGRWSVVSATAKLTPLDANVQEDPAIKALIARLSDAASKPATPTIPASPASRPVPVGAGK
jgi:2',3'-cyclic-nucleotide 2'-phosphodiesterase (5'-nucleotidase family)